MSLIRLVERSALSLFACDVRSVSVCGDVSVCGVGVFEGFRQSASVFQIVGLWFSLAVRFLS